MKFIIYSKPLSKEKNINNILADISAIYESPEQLIEINNEDNVHVVDGNQPLGVIPFPDDCIHFARQISDDGKHFSGEWFVLNNTMRAINTRVQTAYDVFNPGVSKHESSSTSKAFISDSDSEPNTKQTKSNIEIIDDELDRVLKEYYLDIERTRENNGALQFDEPYNEERISNYVEYLRTQRFTIDNFSIDQLRNRELGNRVREATKKLSKQLNLPEIDTVRGLYAYVKREHIPEDKKRSDLEAIKNEIDDLLTKYAAARGEEKYTGSVFGKTAVQKHAAIINMQDLMNGEGSVSAEDLAVLRQGELGDSLRNKTKELAAKYNMPEIASVTGLVSFFETMKKDSENKNKF